MISGRLSLSHPALNLRPEFKELTPSGDDAKVVMFEPGNGLELAKAFHDVAHLNHETASKFRDARVRYPEDSEYWDNTDNVRKDVGSRWVELNKLAAQGLQTAAQVAFSATYGLGNLLIGSAQTVGDGVERIGLYEQTSKEGVLSSSVEISRLTGDHYSIQDPSRGDVPSPLFDTAKEPKAYLLVDTKQGVAVLSSANGE